MKYSIVLTLRVLEYIELSKAILVRDTMAAVLRGHIQVRSTMLWEKLCEMNKLKQVDPVEWHVLSRNDCSQSLTGRCLLWHRPPSASGGIRGKTWIDFPTRLGLQSGCEFGYLCILLYNVYRYVSKHTGNLDSIFFATIPHQLQPTSLITINHLPCIKSFRVLLFVTRAFDDGFDWRIAYDTDWQLLTKAKSLL